MRRLAILSLSLLLVSSFSPAHTHAQRPARRSAAKAGGLTETSYAKARRIVAAGVEAMGGSEAITASEDVRIVARGSSWARNQSISVRPPWDEMTRDETLYANPRAGRYVFENRDPLPGGFVFGGRAVIAGGQGFFVNPRDRTVSPINPANFGFAIVNYLRRVPHLFLASALEQRTATLRFLGAETFQGRAHNVVAFASANGVQFNLFFDARTNLLSKYEQMVTDPQEGDAVQEVVFPGYRDVAGIKIPTGRLTRRGGDLIEDVKYTEARVRVRPPESEFAKPDGHDELPAPVPAPPRETKMADGVYLFESGVNSLVVEFADHLMVVEPSTGGRGPRAVLTKAREMFPSKPVRYVVMTHHHDDHSGGVRTYVASGASVVTTPSNQSYFERMAGATFTLVPDDQTKAQRRPVFEFVRDKRRTFTDGRQTVEVIDIGPSPHAAEMLLVYLPKERIIFQGDLILLPASAKFMPSTVNDTTLHFYDWLKRTGLRVDKIAAVHGPTTTMDEFEEAVKKKRAGK